MMINAIEGATRRLGKSQGFLGLPIRDELTNQGPAMVSSWQPTPAELEQIASGAPIHIMILGSAHPPIIVSVGPTPPAPGEQP